MGDSQSNQLLTHLDNCILPKYRINQDVHGLVLRELAPLSKCPEIFIKGAGPIRAYNFEPGHECMPYFNNQVPGLTKMCDAVLIYPQTIANQLKVFVFLCELKSGKVKSGTKTKATQQLKASLLFARFLLEKIEILAKQSLEVVYRALICSPNTEKRFKVPSPKTTPTYQENGELKWIAHNAAYPIYLQNYCS